MIIPSDILTNEQNNIAELSSEGKDRAPSVTHD